MTNVQEPDWASMTTEDEVNIAINTLDRQQARLHQQQKYDEAETLIEYIKHGRTRADELHEASLLSSDASMNDSSVGDASSNETGSPKEPDWKSMTDIDDINAEIKKLDDEQERLRKLNKPEAADQVVEYIRHGQERKNEIMYEPWDPPKPAKPLDQMTYDELYAYYEALDAYHGTLGAASFYKHKPELERMNNEIYKYMRKVQNADTTNKTTNTNTGGGGSGSGGGGSGGGGSGGGSNTKPLPVPPPTPDTPDTPPGPPTPPSPDAPDTPPAVLDVPQPAAADEVLEPEAGIVTPWGITFPGFGINSNSSVQATAEHVSMAGAPLHISEASYDLPRMVAGKSEMDQMSRPFGSPMDSVRQVNVGGVPVSQFSFASQFPKSEVPEMPSPVTGARSPQAPQPSATPSAPAAQAPVAAGSMAPLVTIGLVGLGAIALFMLLKSKPKKRSKPKKKLVPISCDC